MERVAIVLDNIPFPVIIESHTDNTKPKSSRFPSNWELSIAQASAVARYCINNGLIKKKCRVVGCADKIPLESNDNPDGRAANRRIVILISPFVPVSDLPGKETNT